MARRCVPAPARALLLARSLQGLTFGVRKRWCETFAKLYFADGMVWGPDPELTPTGLEQAADVAREWAAEVRDAGAGVVLPKVLWASPLRRAAMTLAISFGDVLLSSSGAPQPVIKEVRRSCCPCRFSCPRG